MRALSNDEAPEVPTAARTRSSRPLSNQTPAYLGPSVFMDGERIGPEPGAPNFRPPWIIDDADADLCAA